MPSSSSAETSARRSAKAKPDRARVPVGGDDEEPVLAGGGEEAELRRPGA